MEYPVPSEDKLKEIKANKRIRGIITQYSLSRTGSLTYHATTDDILSHVLNTLVTTDIIIKFLTINDFSYSEVRDFIKLHIDAIKLIESQFPNLITASSDSLRRVILSDRRYLFFLLSGDFRVESYGGIVDKIDLNQLRYYLQGHANLSKEEFYNSEIFNNFNLEDLTDLYSALIHLSLKDYI